MPGLRASLEQGARERRRQLEAAADTVSDGV
jgi:hypothetical protein